MTVELERPRRAKGEPMDAYHARREEYVAAHRRERNKRHIIERTVETVRETPIVQPVEMDEAARRELRELRDTVAYLMEPAEEDLAKASEDPAPMLFDPPPAFPEPSDKMADWVDVQAEEQLTTEDLLAAQRTNHIEAEQVVQRLTRMKRKKFFELLNVELAELQQERGGPKEDLKREGEIEALLGLFARVGEM